MRLTVERRLLRALTEFPGRVFTRDQPPPHVYAFDEAVVVDRTVDAHIGGLREKRNDDPDRPEYIAIVREVGYRLVGSDRAR